MASVQAYLQYQIRAHTACLARLVLPCYLCGSLLLSELLEWVSYSEGAVEIQSSLSSK